MERNHVFYKNRFSITIAAGLYTLTDMDRQENPAIAIGPSCSSVKGQGSGIPVFIRTGWFSRNRRCCPMPSYDYCRGEGINEAVQ